MMMVENKNLKKTISLLENDNKLNKDKVESFMHDISFLTDVNKRLKSENEKLINKVEDLNKTLQKFVKDKDHLDALLNQKPRFRKEGLDFILNSNQKPAALNSP